MEPPPWTRRSYRDPAHDDDPSYGGPSAIADYTQTVIPPDPSRVLAPEDFSSRRWVDPRIFQPYFGPSSSDPTALRTEVPYPVASFPPGMSADPRSSHPYFDSSSSNPLTPHPYFGNSSSDSTPLHTQVPYPAAGSSHSMSVDQRTSYPYFDTSSSDPTALHTQVPSLAPGSSHSMSRDPRSSHSYFDTSSSNPTTVRTEAPYPAVRSPWTSNMPNRGRGGSNNSTTMFLAGLETALRHGSNGNENFPPQVPLSFSPHSMAGISFPRQLNSSTRGAPLNPRAPPFDLHARGHRPRGSASTRLGIGPRRQQLHTRAQLHSLSLDHGYREDYLNPHNARMHYRRVMDDLLLNRPMWPTGILPGQKFEDKEVSQTLNTMGAVAIMTYHSRVADPEATDVWPNLRDSAKLPARYYLPDKNPKALPDIGPSQGSAKIRKMDTQDEEPTQVLDEELPHAPSGRPKWKLPAELMELLASHLDRDDIKSMRLVNRELNHYISQVLFRTVVVSFNSEIYGMLGPEPKPDVKGKKKVGAPAFAWKNTNGDDVYNGHGLDVFRGFGRHIIRYGMSFEVNEEALANPPEKTLTGHQPAFWGSYDWPFEEYCRFDDVAGLETAADATPRMKIAFSELSKVKELALSVDSGLGWLNGPDRSIRARILQRPPAVFGTLKKIPDRRARAQQELWEYVEACHEEAESDIKTATLWKMEATRPRSELHDASLAIENQPEMPFLDPQLIHQAVGHDTALNMTIPKEPIKNQLETAFSNPQDIHLPVRHNTVEVTIPEDPGALDRFVSKPAATHSGILFSSTTEPAETGLLMNPIKPSRLTTAQKEWLLETEWAQRAFLSSYMLSVIDNPITFHLVHTLNISRLSDRYLPALNRIDFWDTLPNLKDVTLMAIPSWRSVDKDEAGIVETPKINPASGVDLFYALLNRVVRHRRNITKLTIGWATGGEHAEGIYARNNLLLSAPLAGIDNATNQDPPTLRNVLLQFPFVEHLTLNNCWITPAALTEFVKLHDSLNLKHLVLDSVSLTAILRPRQNNDQEDADMLFPNPLNFPPTQQALQIVGGATWQPPVVALHAQPQNHIRVRNRQLVQQQILNLSETGQQMQQEAQDQILSLIQRGQRMQPAELAQLLEQAPPVVTAQLIRLGIFPQSVLKAKPREGSWMNLIDILTPGRNLADLGSEHSQADAERSTALQSIRFISCGYACLIYADYDQSPVDQYIAFPCPARDGFFNTRSLAFAPVMLSNKWPLLGRIVQKIDSEELAALNEGWHMEIGWEDHVAAEAVEFDGLAPGGTGRFSGIVRAEDRLADDASAS